MQKQVLSSSRLRIAIACFLVALPCFLFYIILWKTAVDLPILDDYEIFLKFASDLSQTHSLFGRLLLVLTTEHNGYRIVLQNAAVLAQYSLVGHVRVAALVGLGDSLAVAIFCTVAAMLRTGSQDLGTRASFLVPVAYLVFQLQYASALNFASSSMQHLAIIAFSLLTILLLCRYSKLHFIGGCASFVISVATSPNAFLIVPVAIAIFVQHKQWRRLGFWMVETASLLALYLYRYTPPTAASGADIASTGPPHVNLLYALSFLGATAARYSSTWPSIALGLLLVALFALAVKRRYYRDNPAVFYSVVFIMINALAVSGLRADLGVQQSLASRYRTYSTLMLAFSYIFLVENVLPAWSVRSRRIALGVVAAVAIAFCGLSDIAGARFLHQKQLALRASYERQWHHRTDPSEGGIQADQNPALKRQLEAGIYDVNLPVMQEAVRAGVYDPPLQP